MTVTRRTVLAWGVAAPLTGRTPAKSLHTRLDAAFNAACGMERLTSLAVYVRGKLVRQTFQNGLADDHALTNLKSISKSILSILIGIAFDKRHLGSIDDPVGKYLPDQFTESRGLCDVTIRHLLTMSGGLTPDFGTMGASPNWLEHVVAKGSNGTLGQFHYGTPTTHVLSVLLARATGSTALAYAERHLFRPLGITNHRWETDPQGHHRGGNDMWLGTADLARIGHLMLNDGVHRGRRIVSARWVRASTRKQVEISYEEGDPIGKLALNGYGHLWWTMELAGHDAYLGWGYGRQYLVVIPAIHAVITLTSRHDGRGPESHHRAIASLIDPAIAEALAIA